jgi:hypothetical protein
LRDFRWIRKSVAVWHCFRLALCPPSERLTDQILHR